MQTHELIENKQALMPITQRPAPVFVRGQGSWLWDHQDRRYLDFVQGWAVNCLGHCPDTVVQSIEAQARRLLTPSPAYFNEPALVLAGQLTGHSCFDQVFFTNSGAEAIEGAIKLARRISAARFGPQRHEIISMKDGFHGRTLAAMSASGKSAFAGLFEPKVPGFCHAELNNVESVKALINDRTCAVLIEPIQGEAGVFEADDAFMRELRDLTDTHDLLLIVDEIQTGVGRTGRLWSYEWSGIEPDIMTVGKGIGAGVPLGALLARQAIGQFAPGEQGGTFNGNALMTAVGSAVLDTIASPSFLEQVRYTGQYLHDQLLQLSQSAGLGPVRGRGLLRALSLPRGNAQLVADRALNAGLLINAPRADSLRFMPALNVSRDEIDQMVGILSATLSRMD